MKKLFSKYWGTIRIELASQLAYKLNFLLLILGPALVFFLIKINLWYSIFAARDNELLRGYTFERMLEYQTYVLVVTLLCQSYASRNISEDIRFGRISAFLLYPTSFMGYHFGAFSAAQILNCLSALIVLVIGFGSGILPLESLTHLAAGGSMALLVSLLWFCVWFLLSSSSFWIEESWVLRVLFTMVARFLSGAIIPLDLFPPKVLEFLWYTPFPYLTFIPVQLCMGSSSVTFHDAALMTVLWLLIAAITARVLWSKGLRLYAAAGM